MPRRIAALTAAIGLLGAAELAPSSDLGGLPEIAPRTWFLFNFAPDDQAVSAQVPRRRELAIGASVPVDAGHGLGVHVEGVWSPARAPRESPPARVDELLGGVGASIERPGDAFGWRLAATAGVRVLTDLGTAELDRSENNVFRGTAYHNEGRPEHPDSVEPLATVHWTSLLRLTASDPLRHAPIDLALGARATRVFAFDGDGRAAPDLRCTASLLLPSRTTVSWFGLSWQDLGQADDGSHALAATDDVESGWWFDSGGALRLGAHGDWLVEVGSALDLRTGVAVGTLGVVRSGDPPRATKDGTSSLELVTMRTDHVAAGIAGGDQLTTYGPAVLRSEIRTLIGDRSEPPGTVTADSLRLDVLLRAQLPWRLAPAVSLGPEAAFGLGLRRDAVQFADGTFAAANRIEATGDVGVAGRVATGWTDGIAALEASLGWGWWQALGGADKLSGDGVSLPLDGSGNGVIMRVGMLATF